MLSSSPSTSKDSPHAGGGDTTADTDTATEGGYGDEKEAAVTPVSPKRRPDGKDMGPEEEDGESSVASADDFLAMAMGMVDSTTPMSKSKDTGFIGNGRDDEDEEDRPAFSSEVQMKGGIDGVNSTLFSPPTRTKFFQLAKDVKTPKTKASAAKKEHSGGEFYDFNH